jgi:LysR family hydrogen peroxide-inducible transcriptional activator
MKLLPSLKQLEYLVALAEDEHFGRAAERCSVTASTLSAGIGDLENVLGVSLAERSKRHVRMTPLGLEIAERARRLLRDAEDITELANARRAPLTGELTLGLIPTIAPYLLPRVLPGLHAAHPALRLYLREEQTAALLAKLRGGEIDAAVIALPYDTAGLAVAELFQDRFQLAVPAGHDLARHELVVHNDLAGQPLLLLEEGHCLRGHALAACKLADEAIRAEFAATSLATLVQMVEMGLGLTLLPQLALDANILAGTSIRLVPLAGGATRTIALVWRPHSPRAAEFALLAAMLSIG